ncbi:histidine kinase [Streptomyces sp. NPDC098789]|uniref:histidine kinase n=1 Tax=Streptomyces sp. NPDC098789 TaxID=3366098 RepID=UPI00380B5360
MHDVVSHKVSLISLQAGALQVDRSGTVDVGESARLIQELSAQTVTELHHMLGVLRAVGDHGADHPPGPGPGLADIADLAALVRAAGMPIRLVAARQSACDGVRARQDRCSCRSPRSSGLRAELGVGQDGNERRFQT